MGWGHGGGGGAKGAHLKSMGSYEQHAWSDAVSIADLLEETVGASKARAIFEQVPRDKLIDYEEQVREQLQAFLGKSESQRPAALRKLGGETNVVCFLVLAILGCIRARDAMEVRDNYREHLAPGRGNRVTTASMYAFCGEIAKLAKYDWPWEPFNVLGVDDSGDESDDDSGGDDDEAPGGANGLPEGIADRGQSTGRSMVEEARGAAIPMQPTAPERPQDEAGTTIYVQQRTSDVFKADAAASGPGWLVQMVDPKQPVAIYLTQRDRADAHLVKTLQAIASSPGWEQPVRFVVPASDKQLMAAIQGQGQGQLQAQVGTAGSFNRVFNRWPEDHLRLLRKELEIVGASMPAAQTLQDAIGVKPGLAGFLDSDVLTGQPLTRRGLLEMQSKRALAAAGRWRGEVKRSALMANPWGQSTKSPEKTLNALGYSEYGDGDKGLKEACAAMAQWRRDEISTEEAQRRALGGYLRYMLTESQGMSMAMVTLLDEAFGMGSVEVDMLASAVLQHFKGAWGVTSGDQAVPGWAQSAPLWQAWWATVDVQTRPGGAGLGRLPGHRAIAKQLEGHAQAEGLSVYIGCELERERWDKPSEAPGQNVLERGWTYGNHRAWTIAQKLLGAVVSPQQEKADKRSWIDRQGQSEVVRVLVLARARSAQALERAQERWGKAVPDMERCINTELAAGTDSRDIRVSFGGELKGVVQLAAAHQERTALLAGLGWDADKRQAYEV